MKWTQKEVDILLSNPDDKAVAKVIGRTYHSVRAKRKSLKIEEDLSQDSLQFVSRIEKTSTNKLYKKALAENDRLKKEIKSILELKKQQPKKVVIPVKNARRSEATAVALLSDWHIDEVVDPAVISGLNEFNLEIANARVIRLFQGILRLVEIEQRDSKIDNIVLALLGDFFSGSIHDELKESNSIRTIDAVIAVQNLIFSGIKVLLEKTKCTLTIPCSVGN